MRYSSKLMLVLILCCFWNTDCRSSMVEKEKNYPDKISVQVVINNIRVKQSNNDIISLVYGVIEIDSKDRIFKKANLDCLKLNINGIISEKIYADRVGHILTSGFLSTNNRIKLDVYWKFSSHLSREEVQGFDFSFAGENCITFVDLSSEDVD